MRFFSVDFLLKRTYYYNYRKKWRITYD